jgi:diaminohydroxyphosphoribosylaminopyrimidine deaminase/5-amino-6-(5-phosphoribosylamino)uracil reductase
MQDRAQQQQFFMRWAIRLGEKGRITAPPNPWVGCIIVKEGDILGEGYHIAPGTPHAEAIALKQAGVLAKGATAYVSLEPCAHQGRTPPCTEALIAAGIQKVVIPFLDPDPQVGGKGMRALQEAGVEVILGVAKEEAERSLEPYLYQRRFKKPFCVLKTAISIDGRTAASDGSSKWITSEEARQNAHQLRAESQAILIGSKTALQDSPHLTVRFPEGPKPLRVLIDSQGSVPAVGPLFDRELAPTLVFTTTQCGKDRLQQWREKGAEVFILQGKMDLNEVTGELGRRGVIQLLVEGGSALHAAFLELGLAHQCVAYVGSCLLGEKGRPMFAELSVPSIDLAPRWRLEEVVRLGNDVRLKYKVLE